MTFYEELGVPPDAPLDTIREAYRNVARLLHPDAQTNPALKKSAEVQMKRINHLYEVLSDPERRRRYDQELMEPADRQGPIIIQAPPQPHHEHGNGGTFVWLAATAICAAFIIWLAGRESSTPAVYPLASPSQGVGVSAPSPLLRAAAAILPKASPDRQRDNEIARLSAELAAANADRDRLMKQIAAVAAERKFLPPPSEPRQQSRVTAPLNLPPAPLVPAAPVEISLPAISSALPPPPTQPVAPKVRWAGEWVYSQPRQQNKSKALFPPEFIETVISEENGRIRGDYHARFKVSGARISPNVNFHFEGTVSGQAGSFPWTGLDGAKGEVQVRLISDTALQVVWSATSLGTSMGLASGTAVLNRRN